MHGQGYVYSADWNHFENWRGIISLPDFLNQLYLLLSLHISAYYVMLMANDIFILVSHHHWEQATKPLHIWCEQNWNLDQVLSARGVSPELNLFLPFQCNCRRNEKQQKLGTILNYFRFFVVFSKYLHISDYPVLTANICRTWNNWIYCFSLMMQICIHMYLPPGFSKMIVERFT